MYFLLLQALHLGSDEKVILIFERSPVNYSTSLCTAYSLHTPVLYFGLFVDYEGHSSEGFLLTTVDIMVT